MQTVDPYNPAESGVSVPRANPFTPTFGTMPPVWAGRDGVVEDMEEAFLGGTGNPDRSTLLVGARGTGKTALIVRISKLAESLGWVSARVSCRPGLLEDVLQQANYAIEGTILKNAPGRLRGFGVELPVGGLKLEWEQGEPSRENWRMRATRLLDLLAAHDAGLLITVDEALPSESELIDLVANYQHFVEEGRKVALVVAGLPGNILALQNDRSVSFLRRARRRELGRVDDLEVRAALLDTVEGAGRRIGEKALDSAVRAIGGYPYMMQLVGYWSWKLCSDDEILPDDVSRGAVRAMAEMRTNVLEATYYALSKMDRAFLRAMVQDDPSRSSAIADIARRMGKESSYASRYRMRLVSQGVIRETGRGLVRFDMPGFREYFIEQEGMR